MIRMSASAIAQPKVSEMCPARRRLAMHSAYDRCPSLEVSARPGREPQQPRRRCTPEMVVLSDEVERPPGVGHRGGPIAPHQGLPGPVDGDPTRQTAKFLFVHNDHLGRRGFLPVTHVGRRVQPPPGIPHACVNALELAAHQQYPGIVKAEHGPDVEQLVGEHLEPATHRGLVSAPAHRWDRQLDQVRRSPEILGGQRVTDGHGLLAVLLVPNARPPVQVRHIVGLLVRQARLQHVCEQMVVAIPPLAVVERDQEQVPAIQRLQHGLATTLAGDRIAQWTGQPAQDGGLQQEGLDTVGLTLHHLLDQVVDDVTIVPRSRQ